MAPFFSGHGVYMSVADLRVAVRRVAVGVVDVANSGADTDSEYGVRSTAVLEESGAAELVTRPVSCIAGTVVETPTAKASAALSLV